MDIIKSDRSANSSKHFDDELRKQENDLEENEDVIIQDLSDKSELNMDNVMEETEFPYKKVKDNLYLVAMSSKADIEKVVSKIQSLTKITWSIKQTRHFNHNTKKPLNLFKRIYGCHLATRCRTKTKKIRNRKSRNINCPAQLLVTVRRYIADKKSKFRGTLLDEKYPCSLEFRNNHNHRIESPSVLKMRPLGEETKRTIINLLNKGHSCASAFHILYTIKCEEFGSDFQTKMTDRHYFPEKNDISNLWKLHNIKDKSDFLKDFSNMVNNLKEILNSYQKKNGTLYRMNITYETIVICVCTPLMQRTVQPVSEILFIEPTSDDIKGFKMYFILTQTPVGALPISCIITNSHTMAAFTDGMKLFNQMIEIQPSVVLTSMDILKELVAQKFFSDSKILCSFYHILMSSWKVLHEARNEIVRATRESYYQLFREVIFANSEEALAMARQALAVECAQPKFLCFVEQMYEQISLWCLLYRHSVVVRGSNTFDFDEAEQSFRLFRLLSKIPLDKTKLFNLTQITDFMCSAFEKYYKGRIVEMVLGQQSNVLLEKYGKTVDRFLEMEDMGHYQYLFKKLPEEIYDDYYQIDMITNLCTCVMGIMGKHCDHITEVVKRRKMLNPSLSEDQKAAYYFVATGILKHKNSFLSGEEHGLGEELKSFCSSPEPMSERDTSSENTFAPSSGTKAASYPNLENTKRKWISYCDRIVKLMENDPEKFLPAVNAHLENVDKHSTSLQMLLKGLYAGFPYKGDAEKLPPLTIISNKILNSRGQRRESASENLLLKTEKELPDSLPRNTTQNLSRETKLVAARHNSIKLKKASKEANASWTNFNNPPASCSDFTFTKDCVREKVDILDETVGILEIDVDMSNRDFKLSSDSSVNFDKSALALSRQDDKTTQVRVESGHFDDEREVVFDTEKSIYVDQTALGQLAGCEYAMLDEKKGVLMFGSIPL